MEIIKEGEPDKIKETRMFSCDHCGCIFKADKNEYATGSQYNELYHSCKCPCCSQTVYLAE